MRAFAGRRSYLIVYFSVIDTWVIGDYFDNATVIYVYMITIIMT